MATRTKPDGGALASIMERFLTEPVRDAETTNVSVEKVIDAKLTPLQDEVGGYDYTVVLKAYLAGQPERRRRSEDRRAALDPRRVHDQDRGAFGPSPFGTSSMTRASTIP